MSSSPDKRRNDIALVVTIVAGLLIGFLIKKVHIGLLIGIKFITDVILINVIVSHLINYKLSDSTVAK